MHRRQFVAASAGITALALMGREAQALVRARQPLRDFARVSFTCVAPPVESELGTARQVIDDLVRALERQGDWGTERMRAVVEQAVRDDLVRGRWSTAGESEVPLTLRALQILAWTARSPSTIDGLLI